VADTHLGDGNAERLHAYWVHGEGARQIRWGTDGAHTRCHRLLMQHADMTSEQAWGYCQLAGHAATGKYSGEQTAMEKGHHGRSTRPMSYTRSFPLEDISIKPGDGRTVDAYAAVFDSPARVRDVDGEYEEVIDPAAFNRTLEHAGRGRTSVPVLFNHGLTIWGTPSERYSLPVGVSEEIRVDGRGLFTRARFHKTQPAEEILEAIRDGSVTAYSFQGDFLRSDPQPPRGGFRPVHGGKLPRVRRTECTLKEFGPATFAVYKDAEVVGVRAEQAALLLSTLSDGERQRLAAFLQAGTPLDPPVDPPADGTPSDEGPAAEDSPGPSVRHSVRPLPPHQELQAARARFLIRHGGA
jgi:HK97 family phage prohead protease